MFNLKLPTIMALAALLIFAAAAITACGGNDTDAQPGLTDEQVREIVRDEVSTSATAQGGLPRAEVEEAIQAALSGLPQPETGVPQADLDAAIRAAIAAMPEPAPGITAADVEGAVRAALASLPEPGASRAEVEELIRTAMEGLPAAEAGLTAEQVRRIAEHTVATVPPKTSPADYTKFFVNSAISRYEVEGLEATVAHYNRIESLNEQWYMFIADENGEVVSHINPQILGRNLNGPQAIDADGFKFGPAMLAATEEGTWVSYVYNNPASDRLPDDERHLGAVELKRAWVIRHDGLLFGSGWYLDAEEFTKVFVQDAIDRYQTDGLEATLAYYSRPESVFKEWFAFIADGNGRIISHYDGEMLGKTLDELLESEGFQASENGVWATIEDVNSATGELESKHAWLISYDGLTFGSGWYHEESE